MAVNFLRINFLKSPLIINPCALWSVYTQILRHNCENKDNLEINFINKLHERSLKKVKINEFNISACDDSLKEIDDDELLYDRDERKLMEMLQDLNQNVKWISIRNECIDVICSKCRNIHFFIKFVRYLKNDPKYYDEYHEFIKCLHQLVIWRDSKGNNTEMLIDSLCSLYINHHEDEELFNKIKMIIQAVLKEVLSKHGSYAVHTIRASFKRIGDETGNYEALYLLWRNLFESFWFSDQQIGDELMAEHLEIRNLLKVRSKHLCFEYFQNNNTDHVNKLIQIFLRHKMRASVVETLKLYLAFEVWRRNAAAATEIVHLFLELNIPLSDNENRKYLDLLLNKKENRQRGKMSEKIDVEKYKFKF